jgi:hypothetical protein
MIFPREINYIWRYGNALWPTDQLTPQQARPEVQQYIQHRFQRFGKQSNGQRIIEKTCANSLRLEFVRAVFPDAFIVHIVRDGRAVAESARRRWQAPPEPKYLLEKARWVPMADIPYYGLRYLRYQMGRLGSTNNRQASWGPRFEGLDDLVLEKTLIEVCGLQWKICVQAAATSIKNMPSEQGITLYYEDIVRDPLAVAKQVFEATQLEFTDRTQAFCEAQIIPSNIEKWRETLSKQDIQLLMPHIEEELSHHGYD